MEERKNEILELREILEGNDKGKLKPAAKRVISLMESGEDVSILFTSMLKSIETSDIELKKIIYLYLTYYSNREREESIMAVNAFVRDCDNQNPIVRALAIRTMTRLKLGDAAEFLLPALKKAFSDPSPYVRKTAAFAAAKIYEVITESSENAGLIKLLISLLNDSNPMVVSNSAAALLEITSRHPSDAFTFDESTFSSLINATSECNTWILSEILDSISQFNPEKMDSPVDRLTPFLNNRNPAVVISAFKCILKFMKFDSRQPQDIFAIALPPVMSLISFSQPQIQFVILRSLSLLTAKYPKIFAKEISSFFCKYNDPSYIKSEKLAIILSSCTAQSAPEVVDEMIEYCNSVDDKLVKKSICGLSEIAVKFESVAEKCVSALIGFANSSSDFALETSVTASTSILRKYPGKFDSIVGMLCSKTERLKSPASRASAAWMIGEYCTKIESVDLVVDPFLDSFHDESPEVQLQIITALVKIFLQIPESSKDQLQFVLNEATKEGVLPDVRNRALIYWRLLTADLNAAKRMVLLKKDTAFAEKAEKGIDFFLESIGTVSGVLRSLPSETKRKKKEIEQWTLVASGRQKLEYSWGGQGLWLRVTNCDKKEITDFGIAADRNIVGISIDGQPQFKNSLSFGDSMEAEISLVYDEKWLLQGKANIRFAFKTNFETVFFEIPVEVQNIVRQGDAIDEDGFERLWLGMSEEDDFEIPKRNVADNSEFEDRNISVISRTGGNTQLSFSILPGMIYLCRVSQVGETVSVSLRGMSSLFGLIRAGGEKLFCSAEPKN